jgi:hypothetical protein
MQDIDQFRQQLAKMPKASLIYLSMESLRVNFFPEGVPNYPVDQLNPEDLTDLERFFYIELKPEWKEHLTDAQLVNAYCAALQHLQGDWWGELGSLESPLCAHLLAVEGIDDCLVRQLSNTKPVQYLEGEEATYAHLYELCVADLAALFLAQEHAIDYDLLIDKSERAARREVLIEKLSSQ